MASNSQIARLRRPGAQRRGLSQRLGGRPQAGNACFRTSTAADPLARVVTSGTVWSAGEAVRHWLVTKICG